MESSLNDCHLTSDLKIALACVIIKCGQGSKVLNIAKHYGINGGTIILGHGTVKNKLLDFLDLNDVRKELVIMLGKEDVIENMLEHLNEEMQLNKPNHGIAFSASISGIFGTRSIKCDIIKEDGGTDVTMYNAICTIVEKGFAEEVIDAATKAGSRGGTIISARGSGIHETSKLFSMEIEPEKEIVLILSDHDSTDAIVESIRKDLDIDKPGKGIIFVHPLSKTLGLYQN